jgi:S-adenosylmethionine decarboxylase
MHLTIDGFGGSAEKLGSETLVRSLLDRYPAAINMTKITAPFVMEYVGEKPEDWGVTGFVIIAESHISIHTFPDHGYVWVDVFSCKEFDTDGATDMIVEAFDLDRITCHKLPRGLEFPHAIDAATPVAMGERRDVTRTLAGAQA